MPIHKQITLMSRFLLVNQKNVIQPVVIHEEIYMSQFFLVTYIKMQCDQCWFTNNWLWDDSF